MLPKTAMRDGAKRNTLNHMRNGIYNLKSGGSLKIVKNHQQIIFRPRPIPVKISLDYPCIAWNRSSALFVFPNHKIIILVLYVTEKLL
jgi:hypothetical protein